MRSPAAVESLCELFDLEPLGDHRFTGRNAAPRGSGRSLFGGQIAAQALRAAAHTVASGRLPHSLHGYFIRAGRADEPVTFSVGIERDGRSLSSRSVRATQGDDVIFSMLTSFTVASGTDGDDTDYDAGPHPRIAEPERCPRIDWDPFVEMREISAVDVAPGIRLCDVAWARASHPLPDDPVLHYCILTYLSDLGSGFAGTREHGLPPSGPSVDHAVWFHAPADAGSWTLLDLRPVRASAMRGTYTGTLRDRRSKLVATMAQEVLLRPVTTLTSTGRSRPSTHP